MRYDMLNIGARLRRLRMECKMSAGDVADAVGKSESHIMQIERGSRNITVQMIFKFADIYETDPNTILGFVDANFENEDVNKLSNNEKKKLYMICSEIISALVEVKEAV